MRKKTRNYQKFASALSGASEAINREMTSLEQSKELFEAPEAPRNVWLTTNDYQNNFIDKEVSREAEEELKQIE